MNFRSIFLSAGDGQPEIARSSVVLGVVATEVTPVIFETMDMFHNGFHFDAAVWCVAYPGGIVALIAGGALAVAKKEKDLAVARATDAAAAVTLSPPPPPEPLTNLSGA